MNRTMLVVALIAGAGLLTACGGSDSPTPGTDVGHNKTARVIVVDGVRCAVIVGSNGSAGIDCDWNTP